VSHSENRANKLASELKELPTETFKVSVRSKKARAELAACAPTMRRRTAMARPCRGRLDYSKAMTEVCKVFKRVILG